MAFVPHKCLTGKKGTGLRWEMQKKLIMEEKTDMYWEKKGGGGTEMINLIFHCKVFSTPPSF